MPKALVYAGGPGLLLVPYVSHNGRYVVGRWAEDNDARRANRFSLMVIDLLAPGGPKRTIYPTPDGGVVGYLSWVGDDVFVMTTVKDELKVYAVRASDASYVTVGTVPQVFNDQLVFGVSFSPDGNHVAGLMTKDNVHADAWVADADFKNMRQVTNAGLKIGYLTWIGANRIQVYDEVPYTTSMFAGHAMINCKNYIVPITANMLSKEQVLAAKPQNLHCPIVAATK